MFFRSKATNQSLVVLGLKLIFLYYSWQWCVQLIPHGLPILAIQQVEVVDKEGSNRWVVFSIDVHFTGDCRPFVVQGSVLGVRPAPVQVPGYIEGKSATDRYAASQHWAISQGHGMRNKETVFLGVQ